MSYVQPVTVLPSHHLSLPFLESTGIVISASLKNWLTRVKFIANTRNVGEERNRYIRWALCKIEDNAENSTLDWKTIPPVMPAGAEDRIPRILGTREKKSGDKPATSSGVRDALMKETLLRSPMELKAFVARAFDLYDGDVAKGRRTYDQATMVGMLNIARHLQKAEEKETRKAAQQVILSQPSPAPLSGRTGPVAVSGPSQNLYVPSRARLVAPMPGAVPLKGKGFPIERADRSVEVNFFSNLTNTTANSSASSPMKGKSVQLERKYSRYEPTESDIRPLKVLRKAFSFITNRFHEKEEEEGRRAALVYVSEQLKGMRQDIRVQSIENGFSINVYELHARICLELGDIGEFNQCQSSLKHLYGTLRSDAKKHSCVDFFCFRLVYLSLSSQYDSLSTELIDYTNSYLDKRKQEMLPDGQTVSFTLRLCAACEEGDVRGIISLLAHFPVEMTFLLRIYLPKNRIVWLRNALCGVRGKVAMRRVLLSAGVLPICVKRDDGAAEVAWLDGSMVAAEKEFQSMCATLKLTLPKEFSFEKEVNEECPTFADSSELLTSVHNYLNYLTTRNDASLK